MPEQLQMDDRLSDVDETLPVGTKKGCLSIIGRFEDYFDNTDNLGLEELQEKQEEWWEGAKGQYYCFQSVERFIPWIDSSRAKRLYKCQCACGNVVYLSHTEFLEKKHRFCTPAVTQKYLDKNICEGTLFHRSEDDVLEDFCGLAVLEWKKKQKSYRDNGRREYAENYDIDFSGRVYESLEVQDVFDSNYEEKHKQGDLRRKDAYIYKVFKRYRCRCYLCGKEYIVKCSQINIHPPSQYGRTALHGYWSEVCCDCHPISSFQWKVNKLLFDNHVDYRVEYSFPDLLGLYKLNNLKFDFAVFNNDGSIKCLIECQGEQHYMPVDELGGEVQFIMQGANDKLKRDYALKNKIKLIEISYVDKGYEKLVRILEREGII